MTGKTSDEHFDQLPEHHSDAESQRHVPEHYEKNPGVVQDSPGNPDIGFEEPEDTTNLPGRVST